MKFKYLFENICKFKEEYEEAGSPQDAMEQFLRKHGWYCYDMGRVENLEEGGDEAEV